MVFRIRLAACATVLGLIIGASAQADQPPPGQPWMNSTLSPDERAKLVDEALTPA